MGREPVDVAELTARVAEELGRPLAAAIDEAKRELRRAKRRAERGEAGGDPAAVAQAEVRLRLLKRQQRALRHAPRRAEDADGERDATGAQDPPRRPRHKAPDSRRAESA